MTFHRRPVQHLSRHPSASRPDTTPRIGLWPRRNTARRHTRPRTSSLRHSTRQHSTARQNATRPRHNGARRQLRSTATPSHRSPRHRHCGSPHASAPRQTSDTTIHIGSRRHRTTRASTRRVTSRLGVTTSHHGPQTRPITSNHHAPRRHDRSTRCGSPRVSATRHHSGTPLRCRSQLDARPHLLATTTKRPSTAPHGALQSLRNVALHNFGVESLRFR